jgi:hypothetical protein
VAIALITMSAGAQLAYATHFRYGHYNWKPAGGNTIEFTIQNAFRRDGFFCVNPATLAFVACTGPGALAGIGDVFPEFVGSTLFYPGDGTGAIGSPLGPLLYRVTSIDPAKNALFAQALDPGSLPAIKTTITHTYPTTGNFLAFTDSCCRISAVDSPNAHINNHDGGYRVETLVNVGTGNSSPVSALPPIVVCPISALCSFFVPAADPNSDPVRFRLSLPAEASSVTSFVQPGPPNAPNAAAINSATGLYTWDTTGATLAPAGFNTLYSTQVTIMDLDSAGNVKSKVAVDFLIQLVPLTPPLPVFDHPPTPACGSPLIAVVGGTISFVVQASIPSVTKTASLNAVGLPFGATMTPALPATGNPISSTFSWTPTTAQVGAFVVTFEARDNPGQQVLCSVTIQVNQGVLQGRMTGGGSVFTTTGVRVTHGFELHCDKAVLPNGLEVNWQGGNHFHLESLTTELCINDPAINPAPPPAGFDTYIGKGIGRLNGISGATAEWTFTDAGEPGKNDTAKVVIRDASATIVLTVAGKLINGNQQAHEH